jgi:hypothetical protein
VDESLADLKVIGGFDYSREEEQIPDGIGGWRV